MKTNSSLQSVREVRQKISRQFGNDVKKLVEYYKSKQEIHSNKLVEEKQKADDGATLKTL